jgi:hypothetical protein
MFINPIKDIPSAAIGYVLGAFTPAVGRTIKSWFSKETTAVEKKIVADGEAAVKDVASKL